MFGKHAKPGPGDIPQTITDEQMADIQRRAIRAHRFDNPFSKAEVNRRLAMNAQHDKRHLS
jgi:hypothetical protein